jgi:uncharacterized protein YndB with AHSA1/START domain
MDDPGLPDLVLRRVFGAPRELVFQAFTDPKHLQQWWGPRLFDVPHVEADARPGGGFLIHMRGPDGQIYPDTGTFHEVVPPERLVFTSTAFDDEHGQPQLVVLHTLTFEEFGLMTQLTLRAHVERVTPAAEGALGGMEQGWAESLYKLADYLDRLRA